MFLPWIEPTPLSEGWGHWFGNIDGNGFGYGDEWFVFYDKGLGCGFGTIHGEGMGGGWGYFSEELVSAGTGGYLRPDHILFRNVNGRKT